jgi:hypothetical protein
LIDLVDPFQDALAEFALGLNADLFEEGARARHLSKECLDDLEPGAVHAGVSAYLKRSQRGVEAILLVRV